jgi:hypothetical protein
VDSPPPHPPLRPTDLARAALHRLRARLGVLAVLVAVVVGLAAATTTAPAGEPLVRGLLAGLGTLGACWGLLAGAGAVLRARLDARDARTWDGEWARVEPVWTGRRG